MKLLTSIILVVFSCYITAEEEVDIHDATFSASFVENGEEVHVFYIEDTPYKLTEQGELTPMEAYINIIGDGSLQSACLNGENLDPSIAARDADEGELYYTIVNNTDAEVVISTTSADKKRLFCSTPFRRLQAGECVTVSEEDDRLHTLAQVRIGGTIFCGGWKDDEPFCQPGGYSYEIREVGHPLVLAPEHFDSVTMYEMSVVEAQADCQ